MEVELGGNIKLLPTLILSSVTFSTEYGSSPFNIKFPAAQYWTESPNGIIAESRSVTIK